MDQQLVVYAGLGCGEASSSQESGRAPEESNESARTSSCSSGWRPRQSDCLKKCTSADIQGCVQSCGDDHLLIISGSSCSNKNSKGASVRSRVSVLCPFQVTPDTYGVGHQFYITVLCLCLLNKIINQMISSQ